MPNLLYHGSTVQVEQINLALANPKRDFGTGFYTTSSLEQAVRFCRIIAKRNDVNMGVVTRYGYKEIKDLAVRVFSTPDLEWLDFVLANRLGNEIPDTLAQADVIIGPVANDQVGRTLNLLMTGAYGDPDSKRARDFALSLLQPENLVDQWVFKTDNSLRTLAFLGADEFGF